MVKSVILLVLALPFLVSPGALAAQSVAPGRWAVKSTAVDLDIPGAPKFLLRMAKGRSKTEEKCLTPDQAKTGIAAVLAPDPKAQCRVDGLQVAGGRYVQTLSCPQKKGPPLKIVREGTYQESGFTGQAQMKGMTPKGAMRIRLDQQATHVAGVCRG